MLAVQRVRDAPQKHPDESDHIDMIKARRRPRR